MSRQTAITWSRNSMGIFFRTVLVIFLFLEDLFESERMHKYLAYVMAAQQTCSRQEFACPLGGPS